MPIPPGVVKQKSRLSSHSEKFTIKVESLLHLCMYVTYRQREKLPMTYCIINVNKQTL